MGIDSPSVNHPVPPLTTSADGMKGRSIFDPPPAPVPVPAPLPPKRPADIVPAPLPPKRPKDLNSPSTSPLPPKRPPALGLNPCAKRILMIGDSHLQWGLGTALLAGLGGSKSIKCVRQYGLISAMASDFLRNPVCPKNASCSPLNVGYSMPGKNGEVIAKGRPPSNWGGLKELLVEEKTKLSTVVVELGTNDVLRTGCSASTQKQLGTLLAQIGASAKSNKAQYHCVYVTPLKYSDSNVMVKTCGSRSKYNSWVSGAMKAAQGAGCTVIDSREAPVPGECSSGQVHCNQSQYSAWSNYILQKLPR